MTTQEENQDAPVGTRLPKRLDVSTLKKVWRCCLMMLWSLCICVFSRYFECLLYPNGMWRHFDRSTIYIAPLPEGAPWRCRLGCEHDTLRLLLLRPHAGTQPIRPTCTPVVVVGLLKALLLLLLLLLMLKLINPQSFIFVSLFFLSLTCLPLFKPR